MEIDSDYSLATVGLNLSLPLLGEILNALTRILQILDPVTGLLGIKLSNLLAPLHNGPTPEQSLVYINLQEGVIQVNLDQLHPEGLDNLPATISLLAADNVAKILAAVTGLITGEKGLPGNLDKVLEDIRGLPLLGTIISFLLDTVFGLLDSLLGENGLLEQLVQGLSPVFNLLENVLKLTVNRQETAADGTFSVTALEVTVLGEGAGNSLLSIPPGKSTVKATYDPDAGEPTEPTEPGDDTSIGSADGSSALISRSDQDGGDGSSDAILRSLESPTTGLAALLAVLGGAAAVGGAVVEPLAQVVSEQISATLRQVTGASSVGPQPEWLTQINRGLEEAADAIDSQVIASLLFGAGVLAILFSPEFCGEEKEGLSSQLSS